MKNGENLKNEILNYIVDGEETKEIETKIKNNHKEFLIEINKNTSLIEIIEKKKNEDKLELLNELILDLKEMNHLEKIKFLEQKVAKNLDEASFSELIKLKSQLN